MRSEEGRRVYIFDHDFKNFVEKEWFEPSQKGETVLFSLDLGESWSEGIVENESKYGREINIIRSQKSFEEGQKIGVDYGVNLIQKPVIDPELDMNKQ